MTSVTKSYAEVAVHLFEQGDPSDVALDERFRQNVWHVYDGQLDDMPGNERVGVLMGSQGLALWAKHGLNVFSLDRDLCAALIMTARSDLVIDAPFPAFLISVPDDLAPTRGAFTLANFLCARMRGEGGLWYWLFSELSREGAINSWLGESDVFDAPAPVNVRPSSVRDVSKTLPFMATVAGNLCAWMSGRRPSDVGNRAPSHRRKSKPRAVPVTRWVLGSDVVVDPRVVDAARAEIGRGGGGGRISKRHVVRGHWRNQACGPALSKRRLQWIEPHWKGKHLDTVWAHEYRAR